jgi:putative two-component system protein, hydrogenase maturation factor HypX/HoxX
MRILLISSAFSGLTQRFYTELEDAGYVVSVELHQGDVKQLLEGIALFKPDLILCPFLTKRLPKEVYQHTTSLIVHPGIKGDRGPSSLDWAIQNGETEWGVSLLEAAEEMDAGDIWANRTFPMRQATKSSIFYREVTQAAVDCLWEVLSFFEAPSFKPEAQDDMRPDYKGKTQLLMKQPDRAINWKKHKTDDILKRINAADGSPGVLDEFYGKLFFIFNAHKEGQLTGKPGMIIATANHAICRSTIDGAVWIGHLQPKLANGKKGIKLPAAIALKDQIDIAVPAASILKILLPKSIKNIEIDHTQPGRKFPCQEVWYELEGDIAYLYFNFHNGGMSTEQCRLLLQVYRYISTLPVKAIVLMGGEECWSNGIHLNHIEAADHPGDESWLNINAIDDLIHQIITTMDKLTVSAVAGGAGAGGAILALAADQVYAREGVIFNPHYKNMGELYGSEYWTYLLPKRVGQEMAARLTDERLPISAKKAWRIGMIDKVLDKQHSIFTAQVKNLVKTAIADSNLIQECLNEKAKTRCYDESLKPLAAYRKFELTQMYANFYANEDYHTARRQFVYKQNDNKGTPENIAVHRQPTDTARKSSSGSMCHFVWQDYYEIGDAVVDRQHKDLFILADKLLASVIKGELSRNIGLIYDHVKEHFSAEEALMDQLEYRNFKAHVREHEAMLEKLTEIQHKISNDNWRQSDMHEFLGKWEKHILHFDMAFNAFHKEKAQKPKADSIF